mmetsp:Transcript_30861/g.60785  ORF Transcript_30861/g.60785 Transcript_30861/m.60785 type:complete len:190 (-) Transcript_30861:1492-2061(-)
MSPSSSHPQALPKRKDRREDTHAHSIHPSIDPGTHQLSQSVRSRGDGLPAWTTSHSFSQSVGSSLKQSTEDKETRKQNEGNRATRRNTMFCLIHYTPSLLSCLPEQNAWMHACAGQRMRRKRTGGRRKGSKDGGENKQTNKQTKRQRKERRREGRKAVHRLREGGGKIEMIAKDREILVKNTARAEQPK